MEARSDHRATTAAQAFYDRCEHTDWFCHFSDDFDVWQAGERAIEQLTNDSKTSLDLQRILAEWKAYIAQITARGHDAANKPVRP